MLNDLLKQLGISLDGWAGKGLSVASPIDGKALAELSVHDGKQVDAVIADAHKAFDTWRALPAPKRGELVRIFGEELRVHKEALGKLVTLECGKILQEGLGEVQEMIDICDFAVGLSRQLYGLTIASERKDHVMQENWHPLGVVGVISAFNFPVAVWAWNAALALVCGDSVVWKPSEKTPLTAIATHLLAQRAVARFTKETGIAVPHGLLGLIIGKADIGEQLVNDRRVALVSATGSTRMGAAVGPQVQGRFGKLLLELGGNNAIIVAPSADLGVALPSILFGAVGTAGQRCTTTRRLFVHQSLYEDVLKKLKTAYEGIIASKIGDPLKPGTIVGPLIDKASFDGFASAVKHAIEQGGELLAGGTRALPESGGYYAAPALVKMPKQTAIVQHETFAPILYVMPYENLEQAMQWHNDVPQGLSSAIFTTDVREAEYFKQHSDCGIANVNIGTSGAEIGGAFGGEKETGGGRESGSDSWKAYMRRQTSTTYYGMTKPELAQGIKFDI
jgi:aldehyde dehydrogenase (NAD+)